MVSAFKSFQTRSLSVGSTFKLPPFVNQPFQSISKATIIHIKNLPICKLRVALTWLAWQLILFGISTRESTILSVTYATPPHTLFRRTHKKLPLEATFSCCDTNFSSTESVFYASMPLSPFI